MEYVAPLRKIAYDCQYADKLTEMLRDRLVCGIGEDQIQRRLFSVTGLTFDKALKIAQAMEEANKDVRELQTQLSESSSASNQDVHKMAAAQSETRRERRRACYRCGSE